MTIISFTVNLAFEDIEHASLDTVRSSVVEHALDNLSAEVAFTANAYSRSVDYPDIDFDDDEVDKQVTDWQDRARAELDKGESANA